MIDEIVDLFPSRYIHLGGDEAWKVNWKKCPRCQARMKAEGLKNEEDLQGYFMARMARYVQSKGREVMGWDEPDQYRYSRRCHYFRLAGAWTGCIESRQTGTSVCDDSCAYIVSYPLSGAAMV